MRRLSRRNLKSRSVSRQKSLLIKGQRKNYAIPRWPMRHSILKKMTQIIKKSKLSQWRKSQSSLTTRKWILWWTKFQINWRNKMEGRVRTTLPNLRSTPMIKTRYSAFRSLYSARLCSDSLTRKKWMKMMNRPLRSAENRKRWNSCWILKPLPAMARVRLSWLSSSR